MNDLELYDTLFEAICDSKERHYAHVFKGDEEGGLAIGSAPKIFDVGLADVFAELAEDIKVGNAVWSKGKTVKVVMVSRLGDLGITDRLQATNGYDTRVLPVGHLINCRIGKPYVP